MLAIACWCFLTIRHTFALPDYSDLWRMSYAYSADGELSFRELFLEGETLTHIPSFHVLLNHLAITRADYSIMWIVGATAMVLSSALVGAGFLVLTGQSEPSFGRQSLAVLAGMLAMRFDSLIILSNSLLLFSQVFYLLAYVCVAIVAVMAVESAGDHSGGERSSHSRTAAAVLLIILVIGDAESSVVAFSLIALAVTVGLLIRNGTSHLFRFLGLVGLASLLVRWAILQLAQAEGRPYASPTSRPLTDVGLDTLRLLGSSLVDLDSAISLDQTGYDRIHVVIGAVLLPIWVVTAVRMTFVKRTGPSERAVTAAFLVATAFIMIGSVSIAAIRGLEGNYQDSRVLRTTALGGPILLLAVHYNLARSRANRLALPATWALASIMLLSRGMGLAQSAQFVESTIKYRQNAATIVCDEDATEEQWDFLWAGFSSNSIATTITSPHLDVRSRAGC